jgi:hypothetical protein
MDLHISPLTGNWPYDIGIAGSRDDLAIFKGNNSCPFALDDGLQSTPSFPAIF